MTDAATNAEIVPLAGAGPLRKRTTVLQRLLSHRLFLTGFFPRYAARLLLAGLMLLMAVFADWLATHNPVQIRARMRFRPPGLDNLFGTDNFGRDVYSRVVHGARLSILIGFATVLLTALAGTACGLVAGYFRRIDNVVMRVMDALMAFPTILLALAITAALGPSVVNVVVALTVAWSSVPIPDTCARRASRAAAWEAPVAHHAPLPRAA